MVGTDPEATVAPVEDVYNGLAEVDREWLRNAAVLLGASLRRGVAAIMESGKVLARARNRLGRGKWEPWLAIEAQVPRRSASRLIAVHKAFNAVEPSTLSHFTPTALYTLAEPGVPQSIREYAVEQAKDGTDVTAGMVAEWVTVFREQVEPTRKEVAKLAPLEEKIKDQFDADKINAGENWAHLTSLLADENTVHIAHVRDAENGDGIVTAALLTAAGRKVATGKTLEDVVLQLAGVCRTKVCRGACGQPKPLDRYSKRVDSEDGRNHYCLECERERVKAYERAKRAKEANRMGLPSPSPACEDGKPDCRAVSKTVSDPAA